MFSNKTTKEPIQLVHTSNHPWDNISVDLFGPIPNTKHVLVVQDMFTRSPAAKIVNSTSADLVVKALDDIYTNLKITQMRKVFSIAKFIHITLRETQ